MNSTKTTNSIYFKGDRDSKLYTRKKNVSKIKLSQNNKKIFKNITVEGFGILKWIMIYDFRLKIILIS